MIGGAIGIPAGCSTGPGSPSRSPAAGRSPRARRRAARRSRPSSQLHHRLGAVGDRDRRAPPRRGSSPARSQSARRAWVAPRSAASTTPALRLKLSTCAGPAAGRGDVGVGHQQPARDQRVDALGDRRAGEPGGGHEVAAGGRGAVPDQAQHGAGTTDAGRGWLPVCCHATSEPSRGARAAVRVRRLRRIARQVRYGYKASAEQFAPSELLDFSLLAESLGLELDRALRPLPAVAPPRRPRPGRAAVARRGGRAHGVRPHRHERAHPDDALRAGRGRAGVRHARLPVSRPRVARRRHRRGDERDAGDRGAPGRAARSGGSGSPRPSRLIRSLWTEERVTFEGEYYRTDRATVYDRPDEPVPIYMAASGPLAAKLAGRLGDGFICTSGKPARALHGADRQARGGRARRGPRPRRDAAHDRDQGLLRPRPRATPRRRAAGGRRSRSRARRSPASRTRSRWSASPTSNRDRASTRFIVSDDPDEVVERIAPYVELGFDELIFHAPGDDQARFLEQFARDVLPRLRAAYNRRRNPAWPRPPSPHRRDQRRRLPPDRRAARRRGEDDPRHRPVLRARAAAPARGRSGSSAGSCRRESSPAGSASSACSACTWRATAARARARSRTASRAWSSRRATAGLRSLVSVQGSLSMFAIWRYGSEEQKQEWLPRMAAGEAIGCFGLTEPDAGSDPGSMRTRARRDGDDWILSGTKMWITNGSVADVASSGRGPTTACAASSCRPARRASRRRTSTRSSRCGRRSPPS